jgi:ribosomal protein L37AE/L43A
VSESNIIDFRQRPVEIDLDQKLDHRKWECGSCQSTSFHLWCDGVIACATCGSLTVGLTTTFEATK